MITVIQNILYVCFLIALVSSIYYSFKVRRDQRADYKGIFQARQNMSMGIMLVLLASYPFLFVEGSSVGVIIGALFLLLGLFNLYAGIRNHAIYRRRLTNTTTTKTDR